MEPPIVLLIMALVAVLIVFWPPPRRRPRETISVSMEYSEAEELQLPAGAVWSDHRAHFLAVEREDGKRDVYRWAYYDGMARRHYWTLSATGMFPQAIPDIPLHGARRR